MFRSFFVLSLLLLANSASSMDIDTSGISGTDTIETGTGSTSLE